MIALSSSSKEEHATFETNKRIESRLKKIEREGPGLLTGYYEPHLASFSVRPGGGSRISVTSSCYALLCIFASADSCSYFGEAVNFNLAPPADGDDLSDSGSVVQVRTILTELLKSEWREDDLFQVPLLLNTLLTIDKRREVLNDSMDDVMSSSLKRLVEATLQARPQRRNGNYQPISNYIQFLIADALATLMEFTPAYETLGNLPSRSIPADAEKDVLLALTRCVEVSFNELCRQLAYRSAGETKFDSTRLAYALLTYVRAGTVMSNLGSAGRESHNGDGEVDKSTAISEPNRKLIAAALAAFFDEQNQDGMFPQGEPIFKSFRRSGRDVGNAFIFAVDTVQTLLRLLEPEYFRPHLDGLDKLLGWIETHKVKEVIADYCDTETQQCFGKPITGWASPHMSQSGSPTAWASSQVLACVFRMQETVQQLLHDDVLQEFNGVSHSHEGTQMVSWDRLLDTDLGDPLKDECRTLKSVLNERMIVPFSGVLEVPGSCSVPNFGSAYSAILFGPPGTAKTTICESLAQRMGWDFVCIDTAVFLEDGLQNVASRIRYVFERLESLNQCVILFDEIEEFCLDRETPGLAMESRLLTTSMLTAINDLRRAKKSIFFLATNRLRAFDSAIIRPGRFDMQLFVGTPNLESRVVQLRSQLESVVASQEVKDEAVNAFRTYLQSVWSKDVMFFNYLEGIQFASACADSVATHGELSEDRMEAILKAQASVMTVRGQVREEYIASMGLSRL